MDITTEVDIAATPQEVWAVLMDIEAWPGWTQSVTSMQPLDEPPLKTGSRVRIKQPKMAALTWEVVELTEPQTFTWATKSLGVTTTAHHDLAKTPDGTRLTLTVEHDGLLAGLVSRLAGARTLRYLRMEAAGVKQASEAAGKEAAEDRTS